MNKIKKTYHDNGNINEEYEINKEGKTNGYYKLFHDNGQLEVETSFKNGIQNPGTIISYHNNGVKAREVILFKNGEFNDEFSEWYENGNIKTQGYYKDDEKYIEKEFYENGVLIDYKSLKFNNEKIREAVKEWLENPEKAETQYGDISNWDTSEVTDMSNLFFLANTFNEPIGSWDVSNVINMFSLFFKATSFNQDISNWNVSNVTNMHSMFLEAKSFNQSLNNWNVSSVINIRSMFSEAHKNMISRYGKNGEKLIDSEALNTESELGNQKHEHYLELYNMTRSVSLKMKEPHLKGWHDIIKDRGESQEMLCKTLKVSMDDYDYWAKGHVAEYIPRLNLKPGDPMRLDKEGLQYRIDIFNLIIEGLDGLITKSSELNIEASKELLNDYHAAKASKLASELAIKIIDEK